MSQGKNLTTEQSEGVIGFLYFVKNVKKLKFYPLPSFDKSGIQKEYEQSKRKFLFSRSGGLAWV